MEEKGGDKFDRVTLTHMTKFVVQFIMMRKSWVEAAAVIVEVRMSERETGS